MKFQAATLVAFLASGRLSLCQSSAIVTAGGVTTTIVNGIDASDIAAIPEPEVLGPPVGVADVATIEYDAAAATASVLAIVTAATDAQTAIVAAPTASSISESSKFKRAYVGSNTNLQRRDTAYPIDTSKYAVLNGYTPAFENYQGATQGRGYMTYKTLSSYNPSLCTAACDAISNCVFANIYYEKDPDKNNNPVDVIKCSLYSMAQSNATATNKGQYRGSFHVMVTGSNGYNKAAAPVAPAGYSLQSLPAGVNAPLYDSQGQSRFIQPVYLDSYSPSLCAAACDKQTQYDKSTAKDNCNYKTCVYANLYYLIKDGAPQTVVCALYTEYTDPSSATNTGYTAGSDYYQVANSIALTNDALKQAGYPQYCAPSSEDVSSLASVGSDFCTSYISYVPPTSTSVMVTTPAATTTYVTTTESTTVISLATVTVTSSTQVVSQKKRDADFTITIYYADASTTYVTYPTVGAVAKRDAIATPTLVAHWPAQKISAACSLVATGTTQTTVISAAPTPVVTSTTTSDVTISSVSTSTQTVVPTSSPDSPNFYLQESQGQTIMYDSRDRNVFDLVFSRGQYILGQIDSQSRLNYGGSYYVRVDTITGLDRVQIVGNKDTAHTLFCTLGNRAAGTGSFACAVGALGGQQNVFQNCSGVLFIGNSVGANCQAVTLTAYTLQI